MAKRPRIPADEEIIFGVSEPEVDYSYGRPVDERGEPSRARFTTLALRGTWLSAGRLQGREVAVSISAHEQLDSTGLPWLKAGGYAPAGHLNVRGKASELLIWLPADDVWHLASA